MKIQPKPRCQQQAITQFQFTIREADQLLRSIRDMDTPRHEAELERAACNALIHALHHPSEFKHFFPDMARSTREYYAAQDVVHLERDELIELIELISWTRKMG
jgi:hypothetical protein